MRTLTVHTADELVEQWRLRALRWRVAWGDSSTAHAVDVCAAELQGLLDAAIAAEAADHAEPHDDAANGLLNWSQGLRP